MTTPVNSETQSTPTSEPLVSIITPVYNTPLKVLNQCIKSVRSQTYSNWELCLVDDKSPNDECRKTIENFARKDSRIKFLHRVVNGGIVAASNDALAMSRGDLVGLLDHDDVLEPDALEKVVDAFNGDSQIDYVYTDEDLLDEQGKCRNPIRKPDWSPERFRNQMYVCHFSVIRRTLLNEIGGFREGFDGSQDYDLILRVSERARKIHHIPIILYHWRISSESVAANPHAKPYAYEAGRRAITDHLKRVGLDGVVHRRFDLPGNYQIVRTPTYAHQVDIVIVGENQSVNYWGSQVKASNLSSWSVKKHSTYQRLNISFIENESQTQSADVNECFRTSSAEFIVLMAGGSVIATNSHVQSYSWAETFLGFMQSSDLAMVGGFNWTAGSRLKHSAFSVGKHELLDAGLRINQNEVGLGAMFRCDREVSALFPYFAMLRREHFLEVGGLDESLEPLWAWIDLCSKFINNGFRIVATPQVNCYNFNPTPEVVSSKFAGIKVPKHFKSRWSNFLEIDKFSTLRREQQLHRKVKWEK